MATPRYDYAPVSEAIRKLREKGFTRDFKLQEDKIVSDGDQFKMSQCEVVEVYRYEGDTDPADEATVYGIKSKSGVKGILVTGFGTSMDNVSAEVLEKLSIR